MSSKSRRFEVLLPVRFNDGRDVPDELLGEAVNEIVGQFGAVSFHKQAIEASGNTVAPFIVTTWHASWSMSQIRRAAANG
jgi:hypothetical protein